ncbi:MAG: outer membrane homotrimeric porin [Desulfovibrio sp.]|nr:outer membrane homotrimeric porin [Desulfovibrio sp.]
MAAGLVLSAVTGAQAIDFKAKGQWIMSFDYGQNGSFSKARGWGQKNEDSNQDEFEAMQRVRLQLDAVASEALSGTVYFEIGDSIWGQNEGSGAALGADGSIVEVKRAYIDWMPPQTDLKVRMGIQGVALPSFTTGSNVLNDDVAGVVANYKFTDNVSVTALWARPYNDNFAGYGAGVKDGHAKDYRKNYMDNMDFFALMVPMQFDGIKVTPWGAYAAIGPNAFKDAKGDPFGNISELGKSKGYVKSGLTPVGGRLHRDGTSAADGDSLGSYSDAWWAGLTGDVTMFDPFRFAWDFTYGSVTNHNDSRLNRSGWILSGLFEYKMDWGIPGIVAWYASGDNGNPADGSERLPSFGANNTNQFSNFAFDGDPYIARDAVIGHNMAGTWGVGARLKDMSFVEDLKHTFRINYMGGTNAPKMGRKLAEKNDPIYANSYALGMEGMYLTTEDQALEIGLTNTYKMYENFLINLEADYVAMWLEDRGNAKRIASKGDKNQVRDAWNINLAFVYSF